MPFKCILLILFICAPLPSLTNSLFLRVAICKWWICILSSLCAFPTYRSSSSYFCSVANYIDFIAKKLATLESSKYGSGSDADVIPDCDARDCPNNHCL